MLPLVDVTSLVRVPGEASVEVVRDVAEVRSSERNAFPVTEDALAGSDFGAIEPAIGMPLLSSTIGVPSFDRNSD